jgi:membrane-associated phospholipid phosphatase
VATSHDPSVAVGSRRRDAVRLLAAWVVIMGVVLAVGAALTGPLSGSVGVLDNDAVRTLAAHRSPGLTGIANAASLLGETWTELVLDPVLLVLAWLWLRRPRAVVFLAVAALGEIAGYLLVVSLVGRSRPPVRLLDAGLDPQHSFPSGHVAAAMATYGGVAVLVWLYARGPWRWLSPVLVAAPVLVALARLYLGAHHPTDVVTSIAFMTAWLAAAWAVLLRGPLPR